MKGKQLLMWKLQSRRLIHWPLDGNTSFGSCLTARFTRTAKVWSLWKTRHSSWKTLHLNVRDVNTAEQSNQILVTLVDACLNRWATRSESYSCSTFQQSATLALVTWIYCLFQAKSVESPGSNTVLHANWNFTWGQRRHQWSFMTADDPRKQLHQANL